MSLSSCALLLLGMMDHSDVSKEPRFKDIVGHEFRTKKKLYLYSRAGTYPPKEQHFYNLDQDHHTGGIAVPAAALPVGHPVKMTKVIRHYDLDGGLDNMYGEVTLKGKTYPFKLFLGDASTWRVLDDRFDIPEWSPPAR